MTVNVIGGEMSEREKNEYIGMLHKKHPEQILKEVTFKIDGDYVDVNYTYDVVPFQRIRRITGYLVGTLDRFNDGKRAEVADRVKHSYAQEDTNRVKHNATVIEVA